MVARIKKASQGHSLVFCDECGTLQDPPTGTENKVICRVCKTSVSAKEFDTMEVVTFSRLDAFPVRPSAKGKEKTSKDAEHLRDGATIKEKCPKCEAPEMVFHTAQLRSADEGQTVFYSCVKCG
ncbi:DNA-directed RNA polymerase I core subunit rpa12 [Dinochytrium kinnereticum]|nr:DNA-directed RNA polymerase I core subunit rpa12 [Dinochytrium kinnereticum]